MHGTVMAFNNSKLWLPNALMLTSVQIDTSVSLKAESFIKSHRSVNLAVVIDELPLTEYFNETLLIHRFGYCNVKLSS